MISPEQARDQFRKYAKWGLLALTVLAAPVIYMVAINLVEMIWAVTAVGVSIGVIYGFAPAFIDWIGNMRFKMVAAVAAANPVETMQSIYAEKVDELKQQEDAITEVDTQYRNVRNTANGLLKSDPEEAPAYVAIADKMKEGLDEMNTEYDGTASALTDYKKQVDKARRLWNAQLAINKALNVSEAARVNVFRDIKNDVAFDAINTNLNKAFARLDTAVKRRKGMVQTTVTVSEPKQITTGAIPVVPSQLINSKEKVKNG